MSEKSANKQFRPSQVVDAILTTLFGVLVFWIVYCFVMTDITDLYIFLGCCVGIYLAIKGTDIFCEVVMRNIVSKKLLANAPFNDPLGSSKTFAKFVGSMWQLVIHVSMTLVELYIFQGESWLEEPWTVYSQPWSYEYIPKLSLRVFFLLQMAIWVCTCFSHRFNADAHMHKDYTPMYIHHLVTIALVTIAYVNQHTRVGFIVLFVHDISDIGIDALKICNYLRLDGRKGFFLVELSYATALALWAYFRLYLFPFQVIYEASWRICSPSATWLAADGTPTYAHHLAQMFGIDSDIYYYAVYGVGFGVCLLCVLLVLHVYWFILLLRILFRLLSSDAAKDVSAEEYEGYDEEHEAKQALKATPSASAQATKGDVYVVESDAKVTKRKAKKV